MNLWKKKDDIVHKLLDRRTERWKKQNHLRMDIGMSLVRYLTTQRVKSLWTQCKKYLNKPSYKIRVKGQHLKKELYGQGRAYHGANLGDSTHMRVYIDKKTGDE